MTQDAFLELLRHWPKVSSYDRPELWVRRVAIRKAQRERHRDLAAYRARTRRRSSRTPPSLRRRRPRCSAAVAELGPKQRAIVVLFYFEDRPMAEIAEIVGCSESTGWSQLHLARRRLAAILSEEVTDDVG